MSPTTLTFLGLSFALLGACAKTKPNNPVVTAIQTAESQAPRPAQNVTDRGNTKRVVTDLSISKAEILDREFLYGSDLQYSAINDDELSLTLQSMAIGHIPAKFKIVGTELQLLADGSLNFESDVNKPGRLITSFPILSEDATALTIRIDRASPTLVTVLSSGKAPKERSSWVRSVQYIREGNYLLFESSIETADGSIAEFMESIFPRSTLVKGDETPLLADAAQQPLAERFRFLAGDKLWMDIPGEGRVETEVASRFKLDPQKPLLWYVTPNIPDEYLDEVRMGIEGWNRYSQKMWNRDMVKFAGKLPEGVKIGDPRFSVVNWDSVADAGAAYESQASDPLTGIQSHALIYLPYAWVNIGREYWNLGQFTEQQDAAANRLKDAIAQKSFLGQKLRVNCINDATSHLSLTAMSDPDTFAKELLKGVLFHEMGHAWGLGHNFKGSLSMDTADNSTMFSTSIMDYNQYSIESAAYESVESAKGPLLEYDRQIISVLYNEGKDLVNAPVLASCGDEESDDDTNGVDPLCIRYDAGKDPTRQLQATIALVTSKEASLQKTQSLPQALESLSSLLTSSPQAKALKELKDVEATVKEVAAAANGIIGFYLGAGAQSIRSMAIESVRDLYVFQSDILPKEYNEEELRARALSGIQFISGIEKLPDATALALDTLVSDVRSWVEQNDAVKVIAPPAERIDAIMKPLMTLKTQIEAPSEKGMLSKLRTRSLGALLRVPTAPFYFKKDDKGTVDFEASALSLLENNLTTKVQGTAGRPFKERLAAATALISFKDTDTGLKSIERVKDSLKAELTNTTEARARESIRNLLKALSK